MLLCNGGGGGGRAGGGGGNGGGDDSSELDHRCMWAPGGHGPVACAAEQVASATGLVLSKTARGLGLNVQDSGFRV